MEAGLSEPGQLAALEQYLDLTRFIDYMILQIWAANSDWPHNNVNAVRRREPGAGFMFFTWDAEHTLEDMNDNRLSLGINIGPGRIFTRLLANSEFKIRFGDRVHRHFFNEGALTPANLIPLFEASAAAVERAVIAESARWGTYYLETFTADDFRETFYLAPSIQPDFIAYTRDLHWQNEYDRLRQHYLPNRTSVVLNQFRHPTQGLYPTTAAPVFSPHGSTFTSSLPVDLTAAEGVIYYTLDGTDPRVPGTGAPAASALAISGSTQLIVTDTTLLRARVLHHGQWSALNEVLFRANPLIPHPLAEADFAFTEWSPLAPAGTYPEHMIFAQTSTNDPNLSAAMDGFWVLPYNLSSRARINGLGADGISFINTGNAQDMPGSGFLGAATLALDTTAVTQAWVRWTGGTVTPNDRIYGLRLQYRVGMSGPFSDVHDVNGQPVEYIRHSTAGHSAVIGPVALPADALNQPYIELRWRYYHISGTSGPRAQLRLDDISVFTIPSTAEGTFAHWVHSHFTDPEAAQNPAISGPFADPSGTGFPNLLRYALNLAPNDPPHSQLPRLEQVPGTLQLSFPFNPALQDITYIVQGSSNLHDWNLVVFDSNEHPFPQPSQGRITILIDTSNSQTPPPRFFRLAIQFNETPHNTTR
ncbi:MAG: CotH kinase family protein [Verrucomicrobia bacterium]|nr:CotH kinase family protein [Verrucomicrobiota bacterium]